MKRVGNENGQFMNREQVLKVIPVSQSTLYLMMADGAFPKPKQIYRNSVAWSRKEVEQWIEEKLA